MKRFYERYKEVNEKLQRSVAVLPWRHNLLIMSKIKSQAGLNSYKISEEEWVTQNFASQKLKEGGDK